eukprot:TRINITY_DN19311_c0_g1_i2.p3 TRINITY_DN19311_c0_g1~~TRINITY_DN19311_c0_g1_i2.p3  ORF type:complete len:242 (+),score=24.89 TRINITY_DN19311_c0_g1_i2:69-728(+)
MLDLAKLDVCHSLRRENSRRWKSTLDGLRDNINQKGNAIKEQARQFMTQQSPEVTITRRENSTGESLSLNYNCGRLLCSRNSKFAAILPGDSAVELVLVNGLNNFLNLYNAALIGRILLTWFPNPPQVIAGPLSTICDPYLNLFRGIIPPLGGTIDLSPILAFLVLNFFQSSAAALPCELPSDKLKKQMSVKEDMSQTLDPSKAQQAWYKRFVLNKNKE